MFTLEPSISIPLESEVDEAYIGFDDHFGYVASANKLWKVERSFAKGSATELVEVGRGIIQGVGVFGNDVYILKDAPGAGESSFLRSRDGCRTFQRLDEGLKFDDGGQKASLVPTRMAISNGAIILNAGGGRNLLSSTDDASTWTVLYGSLMPQTCYDGKLALIEHDMITGGECPLDRAYLEKGRLSDDFSKWSSALRSVAPAGIANRNVQFIRHLMPWDLVFAGVEGGLLVSDDRGDMWRWALRFDLNAGSYPYVKHCEIFLQGQDTVLVGGFDKANNEAPFMAMSADRGMSWHDVSKLVQKLCANSRNVLALTSHPDGRIIVGTHDVASHSIQFGELRQVS